MESENINDQNISDKKNVYLEYALFLILGFLLGIVVKTEASKRVTIGFNDYLVDTKTEVYHLNKIQDDLIKSQKKQQEEENVAPEPSQEEEAGNMDEQTEGASTSR